MSVSVIVYGLSAPIIVFYKFIKAKYLTKSIDNQTTLETVTRNETTGKTVLIK